MNANEIEDILVGEPLTLGYVPTLPVISAMGDDQYPIMPIIQDVEAMLRHPYVAMVMEIYKGSISSIEFSVQAPTAEISDFVSEQLSLFWQKSLADVQISYDYGWCGLEVIYKTKRGYLAFDSTRPVSPLDVRVLTVNNKYVGIRIRNVKGETHVDLWGARGSIPAKAFWYPHRRRYHLWYGRSQLYAAWRPWRRLASQDGAEQVLDTGVYRFAIGPLIVYYPVDSFRRLPGSPDNRVPARDIAREISEMIKANASIALPNTVIPNTNIRQWEIQWPMSSLNISQLLAYVQYLKNEIAYGVGVPIEIFDVENTSSYSGRMVPMESFLTTQYNNAVSIVHFWKQQIGLPLVRWNFGKDIDFEVRVEPIINTKLTSVSRALNMDKMRQQFISEIVRVDIENERARVRTEAIGSITGSLEAAQKAIVKETRESQGEGKEGLEMSLVSNEEDIAGERYKKFIEKEILAATEKSRQLEYKVETENLEKDLRDSISSMLADIATVYADIIHIYGSDLCSLAAASILYAVNDEIEVGKVQVDLVVEIIALSRIARRKLTGYITSKRHQDIINDLISMFPFISSLKDNITIEKVALRKIRQLYEYHTKAFGATK